MYKMKQQEMKQQDENIAAEKAAAARTISGPSVSANTASAGSHECRDKKDCSMNQLYDAAKSRNLATIKLLVEQGAEKDQTFGNRQETALWVAAENGHLDVVGYLSEQGADKNKANRYEVTPLTIASCNGHLDVARYLLKQGVDRDKANNSGWTPLHAAAMFSHVEIVMLLMSHGVDLNTRNKAGLLPIDKAQTEEIKQAIRDETERRMDRDLNRAPEQDKHFIAVASAFAQQKGEDEVKEQSNKQPNTSAPASVNSLVEAGIRAFRELRSIPIAGIPNSSSRQAQQKEEKVLIEEEDEVSELHVSFHSCY